MIAGRSTICHIMCCLLVYEKIRPRLLNGTGILSQGKNSKKYRREIEIPIGLEQGLCPHLFLAFTDPTRMNWMSQPLWNGECGHVAMVFTCHVASQEVFPGNVAIAQERGWHGIRATWLEVITLCRAQIPQLIYY